MTSQWPDNCEANTWQVISNSLEIDFIHGDIHGRSCKKLHEPMLIYHQPRNKLQWNFIQIQYTDIFIQEHTFRNVVCKVMAICSGFKVLTHLVTEITNVFSWKNIIVFWFNFQWSLFLKVNWRELIMGPSDGLALNRRQAIIWINDDPLHWYMHY